MSKPSMSELERAEISLLAGLVGEVGGTEKLSAYERARERVRLLELLAQNGVGAGGGTPDPAPATVFGLESFTPSGALSYSGELGWAFRTPASGITVNSLRVYDSAAVSREISLWDEAGQKLRSTTVQSAVDEWAAGSVAPVTLAGDTVYIVSRNGVNSALYRRIDAISNTVFNAITFVSAREGSNGQFPGASSPVIYGIVDIGFTVPT